MPSAAAKRNGHNGALSAGPAVRPASAGAPVLTVVRGSPSAEEIAALVIVLTARTGPASAGAAARPGSAWSARSRLLREPLPRGPGGWRASALPR
jgi:Acyl-CoA carboxylase epsilon subunit